MEGVGWKIEKQGYKASLEVGKLSSETLSRGGSSAEVESAKRELEWGWKRGLTSREGEGERESED